MITVRSAISVPADANNKFAPTKDPGTICTRTGTFKSDVVQYSPLKMINSKGLSLAGICGPSCFRPSVPKECTADGCFVKQCKAQLNAAAGGGLHSTVLQSYSAFHHINSV